MATEKTRFDDWLKEELYRDIVFRAIMWLGIASVAAYFAIRGNAVPAFQYLERISRSVTGVTNVVGSIGVFLCLVALMFKDLEHIDAHSWGQETSRGRIGGFFRRLASDLTLWTMGSSIAFLSAAAIAGISATGSVREGIVFVTLYALVVAMAVEIAVLNILVRRAEPSPWITIFKTPTILLAAYVVALIGIVVWVWW